MATAFPDAAGIPRDDEAQRSVGAVVAVVTELRRLRADAGLGPRATLPLSIAGGADADRLRDQADLLAGLGSAELAAGAAAGVPVVVGDAQVVVGGAELAQAIRGRLQTRLDGARGEQAKAEAKLANPRFVERAPDAVVAEERGRAARFGREVAELEAQLRELS
jgi:valyl-tRNA synthetase